MTTSFYNGIAGMMSFQNGIDTWGDNIANVNTPGFKESIPEFSTIFSQTLKTAPITSDIGLGSTLCSTAKDMSLGSIVDSDNPFDIAIANDEGWLKVSNGTQEFYTRNGSFTRDANGYLVNDEGYYLMVANPENIKEDDNGNFYVDRTVDTQNLLPTDTLKSISLPAHLTLPAIPTSNIDVQVNLNDDDKIDTTAPATGDIDFSALYDKEGERMNVQNNQSIVINFGNPVTYSEGMLKTVYCFEDDPTDGEDVNINFTINDTPISVTLPDGSTKEEIVNALKDALNEADFNAQTEDGNLTIYTTDKLIIKSDSSLIPNTAAAKLIYKYEKENEYDFSTIGDFESLLQNLANEAYEEDTATVMLENGKIVLNNNSEKNIDISIEPTENSNDKLIYTLSALSHSIPPLEKSESFEFLENSQTYGGYIIDENGERKNFEATYVKQSVQPDKIVWKTTIKIEGQDPVEKTLVFDGQGELISPEPVIEENGQKYAQLDINGITVNLKITNYEKIPDVPVYTFIQNGEPKGDLTAYQIDEGGRILGIFSNSTDVILGQIPVFHFQNDQGLASIGSSMFTETVNSGKGFLYTDNNGNYIGSKILSNKLEQSNVQLSQAMTELIITQKAFSAAAKTVTTSDEMIQKAINLKR